MLHCNCSGMAESRLRDYHLSRQASENYVPVLWRCDLQKRMKMRSREMVEQLVDLLREVGATMSAEEVGGRIADRLREYFAGAEVAVETDADGSKRLRLPTQHDQVVLTPDDEVIVVSGQSGRDEFDTYENVVLARTTVKAANELTKLRFWRSVEAGLKDARAIGESDKPADLETWMQQHKEPADSLRRQAAILGLAAEKTHQFSARLFEPMSLEGTEQRMAALRNAIALYYQAEVLREQIISATSRRLAEKGYPAPGSRRLYFDRKKQFYSRAAKLYEEAGQLFAQCDAKILARECADMEEVCSENAAARPPSDSTSPSVLPQLFAESRAKDKYDEVRKLIEPGDITLQNTVRVINGLGDTAKQESLKQWFAVHLADIAKRLKTPQQVLILLQKIEDLRGVAVDGSCIRSSDIDAYRQLVTNTRADVIAILPPGKRPTPRP